MSHCEPLVSDILDGEDCIVNIHVLPFIFKHFADNLKVKAVEAVLRLEGIVLETVMLRFEGNRCSVDL
jgi:hypothetical protein